MRDNDPIAKDARHVERLRKLGPGLRSCLHCGITDPLLLIPARLKYFRRSVLEKHHVLGRNHDENLTVLLCANCHRLATEGYLQAGVELYREPSPVKRVALMLRALAAFFEILAGVLRKWADDLLNSVKR